MTRLPTNRPPTHPGEILLEEYLKPMNLSQRELADAIQAPYQRVNDLVNGRRGITPGTALRLAKFFDTSPDLWMNLQKNLDLWKAMKREGELLDDIPVFTGATTSTPL